MEHVNFEVHVTLAHGDEELNKRKSSLNYKTNSNKFFHIKEKNLQLFSNMYRITLIWVLIFILDSEKRKYIK